MGGINSDKYTKWGGYRYRKSTTKDISTGSYKCNRWYNNQGKWTAKHSKGLTRCRGHLIVKKAIDNKDDTVYLNKPHDCDTNANEPLGFGSRLIIGQPDTRPLLTKICPNEGGLSENKIACIKDKINNAKGWTPLVGNTHNDRWYYPNLQNNPDLYNYIKDAISWYLSEIKNKYPALKVISLGLIKSEANAQSQYDGFSKRLHSDYPSNLNALDLQLRPQSFIIALDVFNFMYLPHRDARRCDIITETVRPGQMILFTNNCLHAGGSNKNNNTSLRIFGYVCADKDDIPVGKVFPYKWNSPHKNAVVVEDDDINNIVSESTRGRLRRNTNFYSPLNN